MSLDLYTRADPDFYAPLAAVARRAPSLRPAVVPNDWHATESEVWTVWAPRGEASGATAIRVGAAAGPGREQIVLDAFAKACFERRVPFRHVSTRIVHTLLNGEGGSRAQAGRFCVAAPGDRRTAEELLAALYAATPGECGPRPSTGQRHLDSGVLWLDHVAPPRERI